MRWPIQHGVFVAAIKCLPVKGQRGCFNELEGESIPQLELCQRFQPLPTLRSSRQLFL
jgi:hypothetical protein